MRRTREQIRIDNRPKKVEKYISENRYIKDSKYHKNNYWSWAHWESWAAQGKDGGCGICGERHYNATLRNKRYKTAKGGRKPFLNYVSCHCCSECVDLIEKNIGVQFKRDYAR